MSESGSEGQMWMWKMSSRSEADWPIVASFDSPWRAMVLHIIYRKYFQVQVQVNVQLGTDLQASGLPTSTQYTTASPYLENYS